MFLHDKCESLACSQASNPNSTSTLALSLIPFIITFFGLGLLLLLKIFPLISQQTVDEKFHHSNPFRDALFSLRDRYAANQDAAQSRRRFVALTFSTTISLAAVLSELILCEISNILDPLARALAFKAIVPSLLFSLVIVIPFLEIQSVISAFGWNLKFREDGKIPRIGWLLQLLSFLIWLVGFWCLGKGTHVYSIAPQPTKGLTAACLERVGIIGIALMALLSGFAAVSAVWHTIFGTKLKLVTEVDISRKQAGLDATKELLCDKQSRLRALQRRIKDGPNEDFMTKVIGTIRGNSDSQEIQSLESEISGLEYIASNISSNINLLQNRLNYSRRISSWLGKLFLVPISYSFSIYCTYRILSTILTNGRRILFHSPHFTTSSSSSTDPINRILSLVAKHIDPTLNQLAWSRQISFLLSGIILLASFNSVLTTFHMITKISPSLIHQAQANLALLIAQISATYVISSALLLRSNLPNEMKSVVNEALGSPMDPVFVERWFDTWFLLSSLGTPVGIWISRKFCGQGIWDINDFEDDVEFGQKRL